MITSGFFGKLPSLGDFVGRGWPNTAREGLDGLLQAVLQEMLASSFQGKRAILGAPPVMLSIRPGVVCEEGFVTVVVPSQDRVGRLFPLCAGVVWSDASPSLHMGWPSLAYARALMDCLHLGSSASPEALCDAIEGLGGPESFARTFEGPVGDETVPRLGAEVKFLRVCGPLATMRPPSRALCAALADSSEILGIVFDVDGGEARDFAACRRLSGGHGTLASLFDGQWEDRGWSTLGAPAQLPVQAVLDGDVTKIDDDATHPRLPRIDSVAPQPDSPGSA